jgi:hypothetical protein
MAKACAAGIREPLFPLFGHASRVLLARRAERPTAAESDRPRPSPSTIGRRRMQFGGFVVIALAFFGLWLVRGATTTVAPSLFSSGRPISSASPARTQRPSSIPMRSSRCECAHRATASQRRQKDRSPRRHLRAHRGEGDPAHQFDRSGMTQSRGSGRCPHRSPVRRRLLWGHCRAKGSIGSMGDRAIASES